MLPGIEWLAELQAVSGTNYKILLLEQGDFDISLDAISSSRGRVVYDMFGVRLWYYKQLGYLLCLKVDIRVEEVFCS